MLNDTYRIGVDGNEANVENRVGSNVYAYEILCSLEAMTQKRDDIDWTIFLTSSPTADLPKKRKGWRYKIIHPAAFATQWALPLYLWTHRNEFDIFYTPGHYAPRACPVPYVTTVMDLAYLKFPNQFKLKDLYQLKHWTKYSVKNARQVIAISQSTKQDIHNHYRIPLKKISVAYPALSTIETSPILEQKKVLKKFSLSNPYLLYVGTLQPRKNLLRLMKAFEQLLDDPKMNNTGVELVIAGKVGWLADPIVQAAKKSKVALRIHLLGYVSEKEKQVLYQRAHAVVLVGLYEGFGMPPLEGLSYGKVPVVSNNSSLPEVVGATGILVDPHSVNEIASGLKKAMKFSRQKNEYWEKSVKEQLKKFDWNTSASIILDTLLP